MKRLLLLAALAFTSSLIVVLGGLMTADKSKYNNDFVRIFPPHAADISLIFRVPSSQYFLAGVGNDQIYLRDRLGLLIIDRSRGDTTRIHTDIPSGAELIIDSPYFFMHHGSSALLQRGDMADWQIDTTFAGISRFTAVQSMSPDLSVIRTMNIAERKNLLRTSDERQTYALEKQIDGLICTDGLLLYSKRLDQVVYVYRYRNQFVRLDKNLNEVLRGKTIDTTSVARISVAEIDGKITLSKPPLSVNNDACIDGKYLFIQSNLLARNESIDRSKKGRVIDVYNILDGSYRFSLYIDNFEGSKMQEFKVKGHTIVALFKDAVISYEIPSKYLPN